MHESHRLPCDLDATIRRPAPDRIEPKKRLQASCLLRNRASEQSILLSRPLSAVGLRAVLPVLPLERLQCHSAGEKERDRKKSSPQKPPAAVIFKNGVQITSHHISLIAATPPFFPPLPPPEHRKPHGVAVNNKLPRRGRASGPRGRPLWADAGVQGRLEPGQGRLGTSEPSRPPVFCSVLMCIMILTRWWYVTGNWRLS